MAGSSSSFEQQPSCVSGVDGMGLDKQGLRGLQTLSATNPLKKLLVVPRVPFIAISWPHKATVLIFGFTLCQRWATATNRAEACRKAVGVLSCFEIVLDLCFLVCAVFVCWGVSGGP